MPKPVQDTITFAMAAEDTVVNDTVKLTATISCIITPDMTEAKLKEGIREMMRNFLSETTVVGDNARLKAAVVWNFSNMTRSPHRSGMEEITLLATARVHESDNHSLDKRRQEVSREGMNIIQVAADTSPPMAMVEETESSLRIKLLAKAQAELKKINEAMDIKYRLGNVQFDDAGGAQVTNATRMGASMKTAMAASYGTSFGGGDDDALGNAVKLSMRATVELRRNA